MEFIKPHLQTLSPYPPGKTVKEIKKELKIKRKIYKFNANENPLGPSPKVIEAIKKYLFEIHLYPEASYSELKKTLAEKWEISSEQIVLGNGSNEIIELLFKALINPKDKVIISKPSFLMYEKFAQIYGAEIKSIPLTSDLKHDLYKIVKEIDEKTKIIFLDHPHNPTGSVLERKTWYEFFEKISSRVLVVIDEAYGEFIDDKNIPLGIEFLKNGKNVLILRTFSKAYGLAGLRLGYGMTSPELAKILDSIRQPFNINKIAYIAGLAVLKDKKYIKKTIEIVKKGRRYLSEELTKLGFKVYPSQANFIMVDFGERAKEIYKELLKRGVLLRPLEAYGFPNALRISIGLLEENEFLIKTLKGLLK